MPVTIPRTLYERVQRLAKARRQKVDHVLAEVLEPLLEAAEAEEMLVGTPEVNAELATASTKFGGKFYGLWSDMTDEEMDFFKQLREDNNQWFSNRLTNLFDE